MPFEGIIQPDIIQIEENLRLVKTCMEDWKAALPWYSDNDVLMYSEGIVDKPYDINIINRMYSYLEVIGELYFIEVFKDNIWTAIGDVTLSEKNMPIAIGNKKYWSIGIGKKVLAVLIKRARELDIKKICVPAIYKYNKRSSNLFKSMGFKKVGEGEIEESYELIL